MNHDNHHIVSIRTYVIVLAALMGLAVLTVVASFIDFGVLALPIALAIAIAKAILVILYFMHVRYSENLVQIYAFVGFFFFVIFTVFTFGDYIAQTAESGGTSVTSFAEPF